MQWGVARLGVISSRCLEHSSRMRLYVLFNYRLDYCPHSPQFSSPTMTTIISTPRHTANEWCPHGCLPAYTIPYLMAFCLPCPVSWFLGSDPYDTYSVLPTRFCSQIYSISV